MSTFSRSLAVCVACAWLVPGLTSAAVKPVPAGTTVTLTGTITFRDENGPQLMLTTQDGSETALTAGSMAENLMTKARQLGPDRPVSVTGQVTEKGQLAVATVTPPAQSITDYFPAKQGDIWNFQDFATNEKFNVNVQGQQLIRGHNAWNFQRTRATGPQDYQLISVDDSGVLLHYQLTKGQAMDLNPAVKITDLNLVAGNLYSTTPAFVNPATGNTTTWTAKVVDFENATVPAGTFPCVKVTLVIKDSNLGTGLASLTMWYGKGVGLVQRTGQFFGVPLVERLLSYTLTP